MCPLHLEGTFSFLLRLFSESWGKKELQKEKAARPAPIYTEAKTHSYLRALFHAYLSSPHSFQFLKRTFFLFVCLLYLHFFLFLLCYCSRFAFACFCPYSFQFESRESTLPSPSKNAPSKKLRNAAPVSPSPL